VPPDPNDEPASVLLERIHTERVINSPKKWQARGKCPSRNLAATRTLV
jgi:hypothetical protein